MMIPFIYNEQPGDKIFGFLGRIYKLLFLEVPLTGQNVIQSLVVVIAKEGTETTQTKREGQKERKKQSLTLLSSKCACMYLCVYSQHVGDHTKAPHVCVEGHKVVVDDFRSEEFWRAEIHPQLLPWLISMWKYSR